MNKTATPASGRLTASDMTEAALELISERGIDAVTMRALASRCRVSVTTLYAHFRNKEDLLASVVDKLLAEIDLPDKRLPWDQRVFQITTALYRVYSAHRELASITATQTVPGAAAENILRFTLHAFTQAGLQDHEILAAHDTLAAYLTGYVLRESAPRPHRPGLADLLADVRANGLSDTPTDPQRPSTVANQRFEIGLNMLLQGIAHRNPAGRQHCEPPGATD